ncbi:acyltransferase [Rubripirellula sp.]|nr:acyltransferase [Rubripirellula sp.]MDB4621394.1 acyltransferase [Rubripirellula sp.]
MTNKLKQRNHWLDIVRATAIILVVNCHIASSQTEHGSQDLWLNVLGLGGHGVDLFFVLSGWLLGSLLLEEARTTGKIDVGRFWKRRWLRTLPAYYTVLTLTLIQTAWQGRFHLDQLSYFLFLQSYLYELTPFFSVAWSLCVEEHFYLLIAPAVLWTRGRRKRSVLILLLFLLIPAILRYIGLFGNLSETHVRLDQCASGVTLAFIRIHLPEVWKKLIKSLPILASIAFLLFTVCILQRLQLASGSPTLLTFTFISLVFVAFAEYSEWWKSGIRIPGAEYIATRSYSIYLLHVEAIAAAKHLEVSNFWARAIFIWLFSFFLAEFLYRCVEQPFMKRRDPK